jgi:sodium-dependent dicarboxylate transporter 2/3/5
MRGRAVHPSRCAGRDGATLSPEVPPIEQERVPEPYEVRDGAVTRWPLIVLALAAAAAAWWLAPDGWPAGEGSVELSYLGEPVASAPVTLDAGEPLLLEAAAENLEFSVRLDAGVSSARRTEALIQVIRDSVPWRPPLEDVRLVVTLPDGGRETVPVVRWDEDAESLVAQRRPPRDASVVIALLAAVVVLWVSEAVPLFVTSLAIPVVLAASRTATATEALAPFFHPIIALFFGGFLMAEAMRRVGLDHLAAITFVARAGRSPRSLFAAMIAAAAFMSMWMSNTASVTVLLPIAMAVTAPFGDGGFRRAIVLGIAYAATIGGVGSAVGTPANPLAIEFLDDFAGREISFVGWFPFGLPLVLMLLPVMGVYIWWRYAPAVDRGRYAEARRIAATELAGAGRLTGQQLTVLTVFGGVLALWLTQTWHGLNTGIVALAGAVALAVLGRIRQEDLGRISWPALITFGGGLTLGTFLVETGVADFLATRFEAFAGWPPLLALLAVALLTLGLTTVASNTASAAMLVPLAIPLAGVLGLDPVLLVVTVAIASSVDFALVIGTPPTMLAYSTRLFTAGEIFRTGIVLDLVGIVLLVTVVAAVWRGLGLV